MASHSLGAFAELISIKQFMVIVALILQHCKMESPNEIFTFTTDLLTALHSNQIKTSIRPTCFIIPIVRRKKSVKKLTAEKFMFYIKRRGILQLSWNGGYWLP